ncbi:hypothetical protein ATANTOWER_008150, partial [Ataeniobius toweri]|nr:hypothetical protein [Ataeniobius toweri]
QRRGAERRTGFGGAAVSSLYQEEMIREEDKNIFDYCRENKIEHIRNAISSQKVDVNSKDEEGRALLHWACDRGHKELVSVLLQHKADINSQGQQEEKRRRREGKTRRQDQRKFTATQKNELRKESYRIKHCSEIGMYALHLSS